MFYFYLSANSSPTQAVLNLSTSCHALSLSQNTFFTLGDQESPFINKPAITANRGGTRFTISHQQQIHLKPKIDYPAIIIILFPSLKTNTTQHHNTTQP